MTTQELLQLHETLCNDAREIMRAKNHDYAGASGSTPFANFQAVEDVGLCSAEVGILIRMLDKLKRLITFAQAGHLAVEGEGPKDACLDILNYSVLLWGLIESRKSPAAQPAEADEWAHVPYSQRWCVGCVHQENTWQECHNAGCNTMIGKHNGWIPKNPADFPKPNATETQK